MSNVNQIASPEAPMIQTPVKLTFEEYLVYDDGTDNRYELVDGKLVMVPLPTGDHSDVIDLLSDAFKTAIAGLGAWLVKRDVGVYVGINPNTNSLRSRTPDLCIVTQVQWAVVKAQKNKAAVLKTAPLLAVEIVSPSSKKTDSQAKEQEYQAVGIPEYWIVDLRQAKVTVLLLVDERYEKTEFIGNQQIVSRTFPQVSLTAQQVLS